MIRVSRLAIAAAFVIGAVLFGADDAWAQCSISATPVAFGNYNPLSSTATVSTGTVSYQCLIALLPQVTLSRGSSLTFTPRTLKMGTETLNYNLFRDAGYGAVWGDGTGGTQVYQALVAVLTQVNLTVYAQIPPSQNVAAGSYNDSVVATIIF